MTDRAESDILGVVQQGPQGTQVSPSWRDQRKCIELTPSQADAIFFPPPGGKSKKAKDYCSTCPVISECLTEAINLKLSGMWAGTTEQERREMAEFQGLVITSLNDLMPPEPTARTRRPKRIPVEQNVLGDPLFGVDGPSDLELELLDKRYGVYAGVESEPLQTNHQV